MSSSVSEIKYWLEGSPFFNNENEKGKEGAAYLSYDVFMGLSVLGGFFALDHLYLRSPLTFLAKLFVNIMFFGVWWLYDALQAVFNTDVVKVYGLGIPGLGPKGIAAGVLANPVPSSKHMRFFTYAAALFFGGIIGLDSFLVGDRQTGIIRLVSFVSMIFMPLAFLWWIYKMFQFFTNTKSVVNSYSNFFGAAGDSFGASFPFLGWLFSPTGWLQSIIGPVMDPLVDTAQAAIGTVDKAVNTVGKTVDLGKNALSKSAEIAEKVSEAVQIASQGMGAVAPLVTGPEVSEEAIQKAMAKQTSATANAVMTGGAILANNLNILPYTMLGTIALIVFAGFALTYYRSRNHVSTFTGTQQQDDTPPQPGVFGESNSEKSKDST